MQPHRINATDSDTPGIATGAMLALVHPASEAAVAKVLGSKHNMPDGDGRSDWVWVRLSNGDLILGVFPQGETYFAVEDDAAYPRGA